MRFVGLSVVFTILAGAAVAEDDLPNAREAKRLLFGTKPSVAALSDFDGFTDKDRQILESLGPTQQYYGAIAFSPDEGLLSEATVAAANHHDVEVARTEALAGCNDKRKSGSSKCVIAADILPRRYKEGQPLQISMTGTFAIGKEYRRMKKPKAFAISPETGLWGFGADDEAAIAACDAKDCKVVVRD